MLDGVTWFRRSSVRIRRAGVEIQVDPWDVPDDGAADYILLTHPHYDSFSEEDVERVRGPDTVLIAPASMKKQLEDADHFMRPGDMLHLDRLDLLAVPAYNVRKRFHPREMGWLGYVFTVGDVTYYHAGDTDLLPSMSDIRCDVAFLPCEGQYTMDAEEAARAAEACRASVVVPIRWGETPESRGEAERLAALFDGRTLILDRTD